MFNIMETTLYVCCVKRYNIYLEYVIIIVKNVQSIQRQFKTIKNVFFPKHLLSSVLPAYGQ